MSHSGVAEAPEYRSRHDERRASLEAARAALLAWDAREHERLPSAVRALDDWSTSEHEAVDRLDWSTAPEPAAGAARDTSEPDAVAPAAWDPAGGFPGRRTVTIRGQVTDRYAPARSPSSRRRPERRYERTGFRADRAALWAFLLGVMLILAAVTSAHAATLAHLH